jgi:hypothetical protein
LNFTNAYKHLRPLSNESDGVVEHFDRGDIVLHGALVCSSIPRPTECLPPDDVVLLSLGCRMLDLTVLPVVAWFVLVLYRSVRLIAAPPTVGLAISMTAIFGAVIAIGFIATM